MRRFEGFKRLDYTFGYLVQHFSQQIGYRYFSIQEIEEVCQKEGLTVADTVIAGISLYTKFRAEYLEEHSSATAEEVDEIVFNLSNPKLN